MHTRCFQTDMCDLASALESESNSRIYGLRRLSQPCPNDGTLMAHLSRFDPFAEKNGFLSTETI